MTTPTILDQAHAQMEADAASDAARLRYYERLSDAELFLMLDKEVEGDKLEPALFDTPEGRFVLVFDREERLADFAGSTVPYAALSGRVVVQMLAGQDIGLGVNLEVAPSAMLVPAEAVNWLAGTLEHAPDQVEAAIESFEPPRGLPEVLLSALDTKLASAAGLAEAAYLVAVRYQGGGLGHLLGFLSAREAARGALAKAVGEALTFSGIEAGALDVGFFDTSDPAAASLARVGLRFDLPKPQESQTYRPVTPGSDPENPPRLK